LVARRVHRPIFQDVAHRVERLAGRCEQVSVVAVRDDRPPAVHDAIESARHPHLETLHCAPERYGIGRLDDAVHVQTLDDFSPLA